MENEGITRKMEAVLTKLCEENPDGVDVVLTVAWGDKIPGKVTAYPVEGVWCLSAQMKGPSGIIGTHPIYLPSEVILSVAIVPREASEQSRIQAPPPGSLGKILGA